MAIRKSDTYVARKWLPYGATAGVGVASSYTTGAGGGGGGGGSAGPTVAIEVLIQTKPPEPTLDDMIAEAKPFKREVDL